MEFEIKLVVRQAYKLFTSPSICTGRSVIILRVKDM